MFQRGQLGVSRSGFQRFQRSFLEFWGLQMGFTGASQSFMENYRMSKGFKEFKRSSRWTLRVSEVFTGISVNFKGFRTLKRELQEKFKELNVDRRRVSEWLKYVSISFTALYGSFRVSERLQGEIDKISMYNGLFTYDRLKHKSLKLHKA